MIGVNAILCRDGKILLGKRKGAYGEGTWGLPGGHLEFQEKLVDAARRELLEETGITAEDFTFESLANEVSPDRHYMQICFSAREFSGEPRLCEPEKCEAWEWFSLNALPVDLFRPHREPLRLFVEKGTFSE